MKKLLPIDALPKLNKGGVIKSKNKYNRKKLKTDLKKILKEMGNE